MFSILCHSAKFRNEIFKFADPAWDNLLTAINDNLVSFEVFAKTRDIDWETVLRYTDQNRQALALPINIDDLKRFTFNIQKGNPHGCVIPTGHSQPPPTTTPAGISQLQIDENLFDIKNFQDAEKPKGWPRRLPYPSDPTQRLTFEGFCESCRTQKMCDCKPTTRGRITMPFVEVKDYGTHKGRGIRALQQINKNDILAEYSGVLLPKQGSDPPSDAEYTFEFHRANEPKKRTIAFISAVEHGNWTRFMNHSCEASTAANCVIIGPRHRLMISAVRNIEIFEEITLDYGDNYFNGEGCPCGAAKCRNPRQ